MWRGGGRDFTVDEVTVDPKIKYHAYPLKPNTEDDSDQRPHDGLDHQTVLPEGTDRRQSVGSPSPHVHPVPVDINSRTQASRPSSLPHRIPTRMSCKSNFSSCPLMVVDVVGMFVGRRDVNVVDSRRTGSYRVISLLDRPMVIMVIPFFHRRVSIDLFF